MDREGARPADRRKRQEWEYGKRATVLPHAVILILMGLTYTFISERVGREWRTISMSIIREIRESDAGNFLSLCRRLEPGERTTTLEEQRQRIREILSADNQVILVAEEAGALVGCLLAIGGRYARNRHDAYLVIGILEKYTGRGIGTALFKKLETWAGEHGIHRLELTVMAHNQRGVGLYKKMGFEIEGIKKDSLRVDGVHVDECYMGKII